MHNIITLYDRKLQILSRTIGNLQFSMTLEFVFCYRIAFKRLVIILLEMSVLGVVWNLTFLNGPTPAFFRLFSVFSNKQYNFTTNQFEKCQSSIWCWDSNTWPFEHEPSPITTRPGLPPIVKLKLKAQVVDIQWAQISISWKVDFFVRF